ncbi:MAG: hypothetical protein LH465_02470 [Sphingomonas bacterium]|nr:hypothetical protein [Sphingomonas bacterium]
MSIDGTDFPETLSGTLGDDVINALAGNDIINGSQGNDTVNGGLGNDRLIFTLSEASLFAAASAARSYTIGANTVADSSALLNTSFSSVENITFSTVGAGNFADTIDASGFNGTSLTVLLGDGDASVTGSTKNDIITTGRGDNVINSGAGRDTINASQGHDIINGGDGRDTLIATMGNASRFAAATGSRTYTISNTWISDSSGTLDTGITNVEVVRLSTVGTGDYGDVINASAWTSTNGEGTLTILAGNGNDTITGSVMSDFINVGLGTNWVDAGGGADIVETSFDNNVGATFYVSGSGGTVITSFEGITNTITNAEEIRLGRINFNAAVTTVDASSLTGFSGLLMFYDSNGSNISIGSPGRDIFVNNPGAEAGNDVYTGNGGADIYDYTVAVGSMDRDTITDLDSDDIIDFRYNDPVYNSGGLLADKFIGSAAFSNVAGQYRYEVVGSTTLVQADTNGDGVADETLTISNGAFGLVQTAPGSNMLMRANLINGTASGEFLAGTLGNDAINMLDGNDFIGASQGADFVDGGSGIDQLRFVMSVGSRFAAATGPRIYTITANHVSDSSGTVNTSFTGVEQVYISTANTGNYGDTINASGWSSSLSGALLILRGGGGNDILIGSGQSDDIAGGLGINTIDAGAGIDSVSLQNDNNLGATIYVTMSGGAVITTLNGVQTNSVINAETVFVTGFNVNAAITTVNASGLAGFSGTFVIYDNNGTNISIGSAGSDSFANVHGYTLGNDVYTGGGGADVFDYTWAVGAMDGDTITDFDTDDVIDFQYNNSVSNGGGLLADKFIGSAAFTGVAGQYRYTTVGSTTLVQADTNGDGVADETLSIANGAFVLAETFAGSNILRLAGLVITGTDANNTLAGTLGDDIINALGGRDTIFASQGHDIIDGGTNLSDRITIIMSDSSRFATAATGSRTYTIDNSHVGSSAGGLNTDFVNVERVTLELSGTGDYGDTVNSTAFSGGYALDIRLGNGNDIVYGGAGNETILTRLGVNWVDAGAGVDHVIVDVDNNNPATVFVTSSGGAVITTQGGIQTNSVINAETVAIQGGVVGVTARIDASGYVAISGTALALYGHNGTDIMIGSAGNDFFANATGQVLGNDVYTGNGGADIYDYTYAADSMNGDTITDFDIDDIIDFQGNNLEPGGSPLLCNQFIGSAAFSGVAGQYRYQISGAQTLIQLDSNGDMIADQVVTISNGAFMLAETSVGSNMLTLAAVIDPLAGIVADGYVEGATLFIDTNGNKVLDAGEAWTVTGVGGSFTLNVNQAGTLVAIGGINADTLLANTMTLAAPSGSSVVNPLTTLIQAVVVLGGGTTTVAQAQVQVLAALGLNSGINLLTYDLLAHGNDPVALAAQKAAAMIANLISAAEGTVGAPPTTEAALIGALAGLVVGTSAGSTINLANAATLTPLLTTALPGVANVGAIASEVALESQIISNAATLAGIATAQVDAHTIDYSLDNVINGTVGNDQLSGLGGNDSLYGLAGNDLLDGGTGNDLLDGGTGNDLLDGGAGNDDMRGGTGNDIYVVDGAGDQVTENANEGTDTVRSSVSHTLGANVENLELLGLALNGTGNTLDNVINGTAGNNQLFGLGGNDSLYGLAGDDLLDGGTGNDLLDGGTGNDLLDGGTGNDDMRGGTGDDLYIVDGAGDQVTEYANEGTDTVRSSISYTLGANVEHLELLGSALNGTGNTLNNTLTGNGLSNRLSGGAGNDTLIGGNGVDYFTGGSGNDVFVGEINATKTASKDGLISLDVIFDFSAGDKIDLRAIDANASISGDQAFVWKGTDANKLAGGLSIKVYNSVAGAEMALGMDIDGVAGKSPYSGPVTIVYGNVDGGALDFAIALIGTPSVSAGDFFL